MLAIQEAARIKVERRKETRARNDAIKKAQQVKDMANSYTDENGTRRRKKFKETDAGQAKRAAIIENALLLKESGAIDTVHRTGLVDGQKVQFGDQMDSKLNDMANMTEADRKKMEKRDSDKNRRRARALEKHAKQMAVMQRAEQDKIKVPPTTFLPKANSTLPLFHPCSVPTFLLPPYP